MTADANQTVREIAIQHPASVRIFESLGIDYCCGGQCSLKDACERAGVPLSRALNLLTEIVEQPLEHRESWNEAGITELCRHIMEQHHSYVRGEAPRLMSLLEKAAGSHGPAHPELAAIRDLFSALVEELSSHMLKEEYVLFPYLEQMEAAGRAGQPTPSACFGSVELPIARMLADHDDAGALMAKIRSLSGGYAAPEEACPTYRALYQGLEQFERDLHQHVHLENNILFPRALEMEREAAHAG